jgi:hypothetical protein
MPLDPQGSQLLAWAAKTRQQTYPQMGVKAARAHYEKASKVLDIAPIELAVVTDGVAQQLNLDYKTDSWVCSMNLDYKTDSWVCSR